MKGQQVQRFIQRTRKWAKQRITLNWLWTERGLQQRRNILHTNIALQGTRLRALTRLSKELKEFKQDMRRGFDNEVKKTMKDDPYWVLRLSFTRALGNSEASERGKKPETECFEMNLLAFWMNQCVPAQSCPCDGTVYLQQYHWRHLDERCCSEWAASSIAHHYLQMCSTWFTDIHLLSDHS